MEEIKKILMSEYGFNKNLAEIAIKAIQATQVIPDAVDHIGNLAAQVAKLKALEAVLSAPAQHKPVMRVRTPVNIVVEKTPLEKQIETGSAIDEKKTAKTRASSSKKEESKVYNIPADENVDGAKQVTEQVQEAIKTIDI